MLRNLNLISTGWIEMQRRTFAQLRPEIASSLSIEPSRIERVECWPHQLWVVITGVRPRLLSYRCLPVWITQVVRAIGKVINFEQLQQLGNILRCETQNYPYEPEAVEYLREIYRDKQNELKEMKPQLEHQQQAQEWFESCSSMVRRCHNEEALESLARVIEIQSQEFADLPEVIAKVQQIIAQQRILMDSRL